jgi:acetylglutamate kinase
VSGPLVVKVGGNEVEDTAWVASLSATLAGRPEPLVVVHGGGREVSSLQRTLGIEPEWSGGLRVTSGASLRAVAMVLSGAVNKRLVAALISAGRDALGLSGEDGALLRSEPLYGGALGRTGGAPLVRRELLDMLLERGLTPVVSPVSRGPDGGAVNVNADDAAAALAGALYARELLFVSDVAGVMRDGVVLRRLDPTSVARLLEDGDASGGMAPKLIAAVRAADQGVERVRIGGPEMLRDPGAGTRIETTIAAVRQPA